MDNAFAGCSSLVTLDISTFNPSAADPANDGSGLSYMFKDCTSLKTIYASEQFVIQGRTGYYRCTHMFKNCTSLVGGDGTHFSNSILYQSDGNYQDFEYARIDGFEGKAGYFTDVAEKP